MFSWGSENGFVGRPCTPQYEAWQRAKDAAAIKSSGQTGSGLSAQGAGLSSTSISYACVNCDTHRTRESAYAVKRLLPRLAPVANGGFFLRKADRAPARSLA
jgi:hypothetical protein